MVYVASSKGFKEECRKGVLDGFPTMLQKGYDLSLRNGHLV